MNAPEALKIIDDDNSLTHEELASLKNLARAYSAGKFFVGFAVTMCGIGAALVEILHYFKGH